MISVKIGEGVPLNEGWMGRFNEGVDNVQDNMSM